MYFWDDPTLLIDVDPTPLVVNGIGSGWAMGSAHVTIRAQPKIDGWWLWNEDGRGARKQQQVGNRSIIIERLLLWACAL